MMKKRGNAYIFMMVTIILFFMLISFAITMIYVQINSQVLPIKQDMFYMVQNTILAMNKDKLSLNDYEADEAKMQQIISELINKNKYTCEVKVVTLKYDTENNIVSLSYEVMIDPIILTSQIRKRSMVLNDSIKLKMMEVKQ